MTFTDILIGWAIFMLFALAFNYAAHKHQGPT